jgi:hypothetical protein
MRYGQGVSNAKKECNKKEEWSISIQPEVVAIKARKKYL